MLRGSAVVCAFFGFWREGVIMPEEVVSLMGLSGHGDSLSSLHLAFFKQTVYNSVADSHFKLASVRKHTI